MAVESLADSPACRSKRDRRDGLDHREDDEVILQPEPGAAGFADGTGTAAMMYYPYSVSLSPDASFALVADSYNHRIRKLVLATQNMTNRWI